jgi:NAD(P)-dependent dehydrogenase (short-subunit alcohol dehydrogenase family)
MDSAQNSRNVTTEISHQTKRTWEDYMTTRVAFVTGGTRGIGKAISARLKADGMKVAAGYSGNDAAADGAAKELGIMVIKGNVGNFDDCVKAAKAVEEQLGPIDVLVTMPASRATVSSTR